MEREPQVPPPPPEPAPPFDPDLDLIGDMHRGEDPSPERERKGASSER
jgi:hypothetical protein